VVKLSYAFLSKDDLPTGHRVVTKRVKKYHHRRHKDIIIRMFEIGNNLGVYIQPLLKRCLFYKPVITPRVL